ncbi:MAG: exodeoxyribonuclease I [Sutterellaceae bacterium]|nr:exodeoxyribonuclease I [Sutterellaceae bacterium]MDD7442112.1 exodeoxyribonuclease I [Sutterellaceae bacterium]MDY2868101.1 exodeoxyribonuclease I [Mesosutterella sp.]
MTAAETFYWHDYETFGLSRDERRPAQFAGRRTDLDLNPVGGADVLYCRPSPDFLPSPESCLLTRILPQYCEEHGLPEARFAHEVLDRLSARGTIGIGYNTMSFDDEVTRFLFWRNFISPYAREYENDCGRWDLYPLVLAVWALRGKGIVWPLRRDWIPRLEEKRLFHSEGTDEPLQGVTFKLECLTAANGLAHEKAHDAMSDVDGTIALARLIRDKVPRLWRWAFEHRTKQKVREELSSRQAAVWVDPHLGQQTGYLRCVVEIGAKPGNPNEVLLWDLMQDPEELFGLSEEELRSRLAAKERKGAPVYSLRANKAPFVCADLRVLPDARAEEFRVDKALVERNLGKFTPQMIERVAALVSSAFAKDEEEERPAEDADDALYSAGFPSWHDKDTVKEVSLLGGEKLAERIGEGKIFFENPVYEELLLRYRARNFPWTLSPEEERLWRKEAAERLGTKVPGYEARLAELGAAVPEEGKRILSALLDWEGRAKKAFL